MNIPSTSNHFWRRLRIQIFSREEVTMYLYWILSWKKLPGYSPLLYVYQNPCPSFKIIRWIPNSDIGRKALEQFTFADGSVVPKTTGFVYQHKLSCWMKQITSHHWNSMDLDSLGTMGKYRTTKNLTWRETIFYIGVHSKALGNHREPIWDE